MVWRIEVTKKKPTCQQEGVSWDREALRRLEEDKKDLRRGVANGKEKPMIDQNKE